MYHTDHTSLQLLGTFCQLGTYGVVHSVWPLVPHPLPRPLHTRNDHLELEGGVQGSRLAGLVVYEPLALGLAAEESSLRQIIAVEDR